MGRRLATAVLALVLAASCSTGNEAATSTTSAERESTTTTTTIPAPTDAQRAECKAALDVAGKNTEALLRAAPGIVVGKATPAQAAAALRTAADGTREIIENSRSRCAELLAACPHAVDGFAGYLHYEVDLIDNMANTLLGGPPAERGPEPDATITC